VSFLFLAACAVPDSGTVDATGVDSAGAPSVVAHDVAPVETSGFRARADTFVAWQPLGSLAVTVAEGRTSLRAGADALELETVAWGREQAPIPVRLGPPSEGVCAAEAEDPAAGCVATVDRDDAALTEWWRATSGKGSARSARSARWSWWGTRRCSRCSRSGAA